MTDRLDDLTMREAIPAFYARYHLMPDGGVDEGTVKVILFKGVHLFLPNFKARKKVVRKHDFHHVVTGYSAVMKGEMEISAWELSTGCMHNWVAFGLNTYGMMLGLFFNPGGIWKAWRRGMRSTNLYPDRYKVEELLERRVKDVRNELGLTQAGRPPDGLQAILSFTGFLLFGLVFSALSVVLVPFILAYSLFTHLNMRWSKR